jgi:hypothetical protein
MSHTSRSFQFTVSHVLLPVLLAVLWSQPVPKELSHASPAGNDAIVADSLNDGPHVYWQGPSQAIVFYLCDGSVVEKRFEARDTLRFNGFCGDETWEYEIPARPPRLEPYLYDDVSKIIAISDIHGEYDPFVDFLKVAGVVDSELNWTWGDGHLVIDGDVFDRGDKVTECLWLIYRLEQEARRAGGRVHFLLGNHETMVVRGDLRYVNKKYADGIVRRARINYADLYGPDMELGRWLRTRNTVIKLNDVLFVHGGIPPRLAELGVDLADVNKLAGETLDLREYEIAFNDHIKKYYGHSDEGPFWYRGYHHAEEGRYPQATTADVDAILGEYGATAIVVGHSGVDQVISLYDGRIYAIDIPLPALGSFQGLLWQDGRFHRVTGEGLREPLWE